jgi:hypothetical protein
MESRTNRKAGTISTGQRERPKQDKQRKKAFIEDPSPKRTAIGHSPRAKKYDVV